MPPMTVPFDGPHGTPRGALAYADKRDIERAKLLNQSTKLLLPCDALQNIDCLN